MPDYLTPEEVAEIRERATTGFFGIPDVQVSPTLLRLCDTIDHLRQEPSIRQRMEALATLEALRMFVSDIKELFPERGQEVGTDHEFVLGVEEALNRLDEALPEVAVVLTGEDGDG